MPHFSSTPWLPQFKPPFLPILIHSSEFFTRYETIQIDFYYMEKMEVFKNDLFLFVSALLG